MAEKIKLVTYYSPHRKQAFMVPAFDENGKKIPLRDNMGNQKFGRGGKPLFEEQMIEFAVLVDSPKVGYLCCYRVKFVNGKPENSVIYETLEKLADDPNTKIIREEDHKKAINPTAFELEKQLIAKDAEIEALRATKATSENALAEMQRQMETLNRQVEDLTKPDRKKG